MGKIDSRTLNLDAGKESQGYTRGLHSTLTG